MKYGITFLGICITILLISCKAKQTDFNSTIEVVDQFSDLEEILNSHSDKTVVMNFWATSCPPCIKEMPHFNELESKYGGKNVKVLLVSLDRAKDLDSRLYPFITKHNIQPEVLLLNDENYSAWTDKVDPSWFGALPATLILHDEQRKFRFGIYESYEDLLGDVNSMK